MLDPLDRDNASFHDQAAVLRVTLDNMDQGLIMTDPGGRVAVCNKQAITLLDLPVALMASHPRVEEVISYQARHGEFDGRPVDRSLQSEEPGICERTRPNGTVLEIRCVPLPSGGVVCTYTNVTERRKSAEQLRIARDAAEAAREAAEAASRAKTDFRAAMSHEIRTPLNAIIGFSDLMAESGRLEPDLQRHADIVRSSGEALLTVVNDILDFSKVEAGKVVLAQTAFSPTSLLENCIAIVRGSVIAKSLALDLHIEPDLPDALIGDQARLRQVLLNLLNNAVKFTSHGSVTLAVRCEDSTPAGDTILFSVKDTGIGIAKDKQHCLFETFSQVDSSISRDFGGTGLGLAICRRLVMLMGGTIGVESDAGLGSDFWFRVTLPIGKLDKAASDLPRAAQAWRRGRLLVVEDVEVNQTLARLVLEAAGHRVDIAADGKTAIAALRGKQLYDLVLMDVQMQGMDGLTATRLIRDLPGARGKIPIIAMTANVLPEQVRHFKDAGMNDSVGKPFHRAQLYATIDRWLSFSVGREPTLEIQELPETQDQQEIDTAVFDQIVALLGDQAVSGVLVKLSAQLQACCVLMEREPLDRIGIRRDVHNLVPAVGMIGLTYLSTAFVDILGFDEACGHRDGEEAFATLLQSTAQIVARAATATLEMAATLKTRSTPDQVAGRQRLLG